MFDGDASKMNKSSTFITGITLSVIQNLYADTTPMLVDFPAYNPVVLGQGWNIEAAEKSDSICVSFDTVTLDYNDKRITYEKVVDNESLQKTLEVSASASFKSITGSYSASTDFVHATNLKSTSTYLSVFAEVIRGPTFAAPKTKPTLIVTTTTNNQNDEKLITGGAVTLTSKHLDLAKSNIAEFYRQCGTGFVATIQPGAIIKAVLEISGTSEEEKKSLGLSVSGSAGGGGLAASIKQAVSSFQSTARLNIYMNSIGGNDKTLSTTLEALDAELTSLPQYAKESPRPLKIIVRDYSSLSNWPGDLERISFTPQETIIRAYSRLKTILAYAQTASNSDNGWLLAVDTTRSSTMMLSDEIQNEMSKLKDLAILCSKSENCDVSLWTDWNDLDLRMRLPFRGRFADLNLAPDASDLAEKLVDARIHQWIDEVSEFRCSKMSECLSFSKRDQLRNKALKRIKDALLAGT
jgi:hypothetical protein